MSKARAKIPFVMSGVICGACRIRYLTREASCVCETESVMGTGRFDFRSAGPLACENLATFPTTEDQRPQQLSALELPGEQKFGLIYLRKSGPESAATLICAKLDEVGVPFPSKHPHWYDLRRFGYVTLTGNRHSLTPKGMAASKVIMKDLSAKFGIHRFTREGSSRAGLLSQCSCGWRSSRAHYSQGGQSKLNSAETFHIKMVETGKWPPRSLDEFLNEHMPLQLPFNASQGQRTAEQGNPNAS